MSPMLGRKKSGLGMGAHRAFYNHLVMKNVMVTAASVSHMGHSSMMFMTVSFRACSSQAEQKCNDDSYHEASFKLSINFLVSGARR
jgi:hypothetical protein